jgi:hypothetical protein
MMSQQGGMFSTLKIGVLLFAYFAAFQLGKMSERPKSQWPKLKAGANPIMSGDWGTWQKLYLGLVALAVLLTLIGPGGMGGFGGMGGYGGMGGMYG